MKVKPAWSARGQPTVNCLAVQLWVFFFADGQGRSWVQTANFNQSENDDGFGLMSNNNNLITPSRAGGGSTNWPPQALMFAVIQIQKWLTRHKSARRGGRVKKRSLMAVWKQKLIRIRAITTGGQSKLAGRWGVTHTQLSRASDWVMRRRLLQVKSSQICTNVRKTEDGLLHKREEEANWGDLFLVDGPFFFCVN